MKNIFFSFCFLFFSFCALADSGVNEFNQKKYDSAFRILLPQADSGNASALFYLGRIYFEGLGSAPKDSNKGLSLISSSASKNFEPAIRFLAKHNEKNGNLKLALTYYEKLKANGDVSVIENISDLNEKLFNKDRELTRDYCNSLESAKVLNKQFNEVRYANCIIESKITGKTLSDGIIFLRTLADKGNESASIQLIPYLTNNRSDKLWDPIFVDGFILKNITNTSVLDKAKFAISKSEINFELCRFTPPGSNAQTQNLRSAICRLSAFKGDQKAISFVAERHLFGTDFFVFDIVIANFYIDLLDSSSVKNELKLYSLQLAGNADIHYDFLVKNVNINTSKFNEGLLFQIKNLNDRASNNEITSPSVLIKNASIFNQYGDCKSRLAFNKFIDKFYLTNSKNIYIEDDEKKSLSTVIKLDDCIKTTASSSQIASTLNSTSTSTPSASAVADASFLTNKPLLPSSTAQPSTAQPSTAQPSTAQPSTAQPSTAQPSTAQPSTAQPSTAQPSIPTFNDPKNFSVYLSNCDKQIVESCVIAASLILDNLVLKEISSSSERREIAFDLLDKAIKNGNLEAKFILYDNLTKIKLKTPDHFYRLKILVSDFASISLDSAKLRVAHDTVVTPNPIAGLVNTLAGKTKEFCNQAILFSVKSDFSNVEKLYISEILNSNLCKLVKSQSDKSQSTND
jgi:TPR repeat protein